MAMPHIEMPEFIKDVIDDPRQRGVLIAGVLSLFVVGLVPRVLSPGLPSSQEQLRSDPEIQNLLLLVSFASAAAVILGGLVSDLFRRRRLLIGSLLIVVVASLVSVLFPAGTIFYVSNFAAVTAAGVVLAFAIGTVAVTYEGIPRATALGAVYGAYGAGAALAPAVLTIILVRIPSDDPTRPAGYAFETWLAYVLTAIMALIALWAARRWMPSLPGDLPAPRMAIVTVALWAISILALVSGILALASRGGMLVPIALLVLGALGFATAVARGRRGRAFQGLRFDQRGMASALVVGIIVGFAQMIPLVLLPGLFEYALDYGQLFALLAIAPFAIALFVAGPVSGLLLRRYQPRVVMALGTSILGLANILLASLFTVLGDNPSYLTFIVPLAFIGAGFVFSTTVRTAIVFASTPRGLPASAAAINETSVGLGARLGIVLATTTVAARAVDSARATAAGRPNADALVEEFRMALDAIGTPRYREIITAALEGSDQVKEQAYVAAYLDGVQVVLYGSGIIAVLGAVGVWFLMGKRDPLRTVFDMQDERVENPSDETAEGA